MPSDKPVKKKLKQSRLPFSPIDPKTQKKRKLSSDFGNQSSKSLRTEAVLSEKEECVSPKHSNDIEIIASSNQDSVVEEKENLKCKSTEKIIKHNVETPMEDSNDGIEVLEIIEKSNSPKEVSESSSVKKQESKNIETVNKSKRKRESISKVSSSNIKKFFKNTGEQQESSGKPEKSTTKGKSKINEQAKDKLDRFNQCSKESELNESSESNSTAVTSDSSTSSTGEEKTKKDKDVSASEKRKSISKVSSSNIKKFFKNTEEKQESSEKPEKSITKGKSEINEQDKDKLANFNHCSKESELNESSESNSTAVTSDSSTSSTGEEKTKKDEDVSAPKTPLLKTSVKKKLTPKQKLLEEMKKKKHEERLMSKLQKDQEKKEKEREKQRLKEERQRKRIEEQEMKEKEKEEKRQKREEERLKREEKKEEERLKKEEEKQKREEKLLAEEEEREKQKKLKAKFAQFFLPKKLDSQNQQKESENSSSDNFVHFQVKENMKIAPVVRRSLSQKDKLKLEDVLHTPLKEINYLQEIKEGGYLKGKSCQTFPPVDKLEDDEICEIISDEEDIDGTDVLEVKSCQRKRVKAKFLKFCENNRPAYYGTWSKKSVHINGRKPFKKEEIFDYDYDSDEDWEDIENGESLSDSDGEGDDGGKEDSNQYEVDNEFFVPHGYLSEGEGEDEENEQETKEENKEKDENVQKERLKQKQEEFELEMKQKTKQLKPKVYGCVWLGDKSSHQAYDQLLKILMPYKAMVMFGTCPIELGGKEMNNQELKENDDDEGHEDDSGKKYFVKSFPEKAIPDLIRLIHGNRHSKLFLMREFSEYWKKKQGEEADADSGFIAMRKIEPKIQEIGQYGRFSENGVSLKYRTWYVSREIREKYGLEDLSLNNSWQYTLPVKEWKYESKEDKSDKPDKPDEPEDSTVSKPQTKPPFTGTNLITKFTKVLDGEEEKKKLFNLASNNIVQSPSSTDASASPDNTKIPSNSGTMNNLTATPSGGKKGRNKVNLMSVTKEKVENSKSKNSIVTMFKNIEKEKTVGEKKSSSADKAEQLECIVLE